MEKRSAKPELHPGHHGEVLATLRHGKNGLGSGGEGKQEKWELGTSDHVILEENQPKRGRMGAEQGWEWGCCAQHCWGARESSGEGVGMCSKGMSSKLSPEKIQIHFRTNMSSKQAEKTGSREKPAPQYSKVSSWLKFSPPG